MVAAVARPAPPRRWRTRLSRPRICPTFPSAALKRYEGSYIVGGERFSFTDFKVPLAPLELTERTDRSNNHLYLPKSELELEGTLTRLYYVVPPDRSPLEVLRNYEDEVRAAGGDIKFECKGEACGGDPERAASGGGGDSSLTMYFFNEQDIKEPSFSNGSCAVNSNIADQRFFVGQIPGAGGDTYVAVQTYQMLDDLYCKVLNGRTVAVVHILEPKGREQRMVTVGAKEMSAALASTGRIALYGIHFDTNKTELKPELRRHPQGDHRPAVG